MDYSKPELIEYGGVEELTALVGGTFRDFPQGTPVTPGCPSPPQPCIDP